MKIVDRVFLDPGDLGWIWRRAQQEEISISEVVEDAVLSAMEIPKKGRLPASTGIPTALFFRASFLYQLASHLKESARNDLVKYGYIRWAIRRARTIS